MIASIFDENEFLGKADVELKCNEHFCEFCGDCLSCYSEDECPDGGHVLVLYTDDLPFPAPKPYVPFTEVPR